MNIILQRGKQADPMVLLKTAPANHQLAAQATCFTEYRFIRSKRVVCYNTCSMSSCMIVICELGAGQWTRIMGHGHGHGDGGGCIRAHGGV